MENAFCIEVGKRLKEARVENWLTREEVCSRIYGAITPQQLRQLEEGMLIVPGYVTFLLATVYGRRQTDFTDDALALFRGADSAAG